MKKRKQQDDNDEMLMPLKKKQKLNTPPVPLPLAFLNSKKQATASTKPSSGIWPSLVYFCIQESEMVQQFFVQATTYLQANLPSILQQNVQLLPIDCKEAHISLSKVISLTFAQLDAFSAHIKALFANYREHQLNISDLQFVWKYDTFGNVQVDLFTNEQRNQIFVALSFNDCKELLLQHVMDDVQVACDKLGHKQRTFANCKFHISIATIKGQDMKALIAQIFQHDSSHTVIMKQAVPELCAAPLFTLRNALYLKYGNRVTTFT